MKWQKLGLIFCPDSKMSWMQSHAMLPFAKKINASIFRIYFSVRDETNRGHGAFLDIDLHDPKKVLNLSSEPVLNPGELGSFDDAGVTLNCETQINGNRYLWYTGWSSPAPGSFETFCGLAKYNSHDEQFEKINRTPFLGRSELDPGSIGFLQVLEHHGRYQMWYESNLGLARNKIKYAESTDGLHWQMTGIDCIKLKDGEQMLSRPSVLIESGEYQMWYSLKINDQYRLGYATSHDGKVWERRDSEVGIFPGDDAWESDEIEYPFVFDDQGDRYMLYNGNAYGKTGFGLARLVKS